MKKRETCFVLARCFVLCLALYCGAALFNGNKLTALASSTSAITSESIKAKEQKVSEAKKEKDNLKNNLTNMQKIKKELEQKKASLASYIRQLDNNLAQIEQNILDLTNQIDAKEEAIRQTEEELDAALAREQFQKESVIACIKFIYEAGNPDMVEMLIKSKSFGDFLNKADYVERVLNYGHRLWADYKIIREYVELCKEQLEIEKEVLNTTKDNVVQEQKYLEELIEQKSREIINYSNDIDNKEKAIKEYEEEIKAQEEEIKVLEAAIAEEKRKLLESSKKVLTYDGGVFKFPLATYTRISDEFGMRTDPILGTQQFHSGVDFASPKGTAIYAAYDGRVVAATYNASMGNYVMIDHGDGLYTIYMHASALYVKKDQVVVKGDKIAAVGSTGRSTGNHLHFSVRLNGQYVSPWNYLKQ